MMTYVIVKKTKESIVMGTDDSYEDYYSDDIIYDNIAETKTFDDAIKKTIASIKKDYYAMDAIDKNEMQQAMQENIEIFKSNKHEVTFEDIDDESCEITYSIEQQK